MTATASEDWTLLMKICEEASKEAGAKEAAKALRSEFKYAVAPEPLAMLSAARLWAIMLRNTQAPFVQATSTTKFLDVVEDALNNPDTSPVVRDRLLSVLAGASSQFGNKFSNFRNSWRKVKPREAPVEGIPFDPKDSMFQPPSRRLPKLGFVADPIQSQTSLQSANNRPLPPVPNAQHPAVFQGAEKHRPRISQMIISPEEDIRRLFEECEIAKSNAGLLTIAMTYAEPEEIVAGGSGGLIREFYLKCMHSQEIITAQIPWVTLQSERARAAFLQQHKARPSLRSGLKGGF
ncbi:hypothetical protein FRC00_004700 [Tulasnella sp. 408]|nr:hypothetical protein FRC00_004700 [Tulasnella sp. 408]